MEKSKIKNQKSKLRGGQVMLLTVLIISGTILSVSTLASILMVNQIRQSANTANSLEAVFAADAGLEWSLYRNFKNPNYPKPPLGNTDFITQVTGSEDGIEFRSVGCAGALRQDFIGGGNVSSDKCPRIINRSLQLFFEVVL